MLNWNTTLLSKSPIDKYGHVRIAQINFLNLQKMYIDAISYSHYQKVIHRLFPLILIKTKLYTQLSTLSTVINYLCRMDNLVSITKMRFVTYDKSTKNRITFIFPAWQYNCRIIKETDNKLVVWNNNLTKK